MSARAILPNELFDLDFNWLITNYEKKGKAFIMVSIEGAPVVLIMAPELTKSRKEIKQNFAGEIEER
jgi:hypothetical protein